MLSTSQATSLTCVPDGDEIKAAVFALSADSSPGPDGFGGGFFQGCWNIIHKDVTVAVQRFFTHTYIPTGLNSSILILLPKKDSPATVTDYRPIVLSNFLFKIFSKILATRLADVANAIVSPHQFGFIHGRNIQDCIALGSEGVNCLDFSNKGENMAIQIDISKAFDTISWRFIFRVLKAYGFPRRFIDQIQAIFASAKISILCNGKLHGFFACSRGVRQGDPLSPILFGIAEEVLSRIFFRYVNDRAFIPMTYTRYKAFPSHLLYADDILVFCKASVDNASACLRIFQEYGGISGQICNARKSHIFFGKGVDTALKHRISRILGFPQGSLPFTYLGVPLFVGHPKVEHLLAIKDKVMNQFSKWKGNQLSLAGRLCLINSVVQSSLTHTMMVYRWPASFVHALDKACRNFLWSGDISSKGSCPISWNTVCLPRQEGGLGIRSFARINECLLSKLAWKIMVHEGFGFDLFRTKYLKEGLRPKYIQHTSTIWTSVRRSYSRISEEVHCCLGDGSTILFWQDDWLGYRLWDRLKIPEYMRGFLSHRVSDYFYDGIWHFSQSFIDFFPDIVVDILTLPIGDGVDVRFWKPALHGQVTSKLMHSHLARRGLKVKWGGWLWAAHVPMSRSIIGWRIIHARLPTLDLLRRRGFMGPNFCILCCASEESIDHTFWSCSVTKVVWFAFLSWFGLQDHVFADFLDFLVFAMNRNHSPQVSNLWKLGILTVVWAIWFTRRRCIWDDVPVCTYRILQMVKSSIIESSSAHNLGFCSNSWSEVVILRNLGVACRHAPPPDLVSVSWWPPLPGWMKVNTDGSALGSPGQIGAGGVFRDAFSVVRGCFHVQGGVGFAFEAELLAAITAIEIAHRLGWHRLWLETDSTYIAGLLSARSRQVPWRYFGSWSMILSFLEGMEFQVSHIYREGNTVADIMANQDTPSGWWPYAIPLIRDAVVKDVSTPRFVRRS